MSAIDLNAFQKENLKILRVYGVTGGRCHCKAPACPAPGKHPAPWRGGKNLGVYNAVPANDVTPEDLEGFNLGVATGDVIVVDIDPRNGGHFAWHDITKGHEVPETWEVETGSGGSHFYFRLPSGLAIKNQSFRGIDIQSHGKYVVAPPSSHRDGGVYTWVQQDQIAPIPGWLLDKLIANDTAIDAGMIDTEETGNVVPAGYEVPLLLEILGKLTPRIGYDNWLGVGMGLHATGLKDAFTWWDDWSAKDPEQYKKGECAAKWKSFKILPGERYTYRFIYATAQLHGIEYGGFHDLIGDWKKAEVTVTEVFRDDVVASENLDHGVILNSLYQHFLAKSYVPLHSFAMASALQVLSGAAQGSYKTWTGAPLSIYQWCAAGAGVGKGSYVDEVQVLIREISPNLLAPTVGSSAGLRMAFMGFNSLVSVKDEWHDEFLGISESKNEYSRAILSDYKILFNGPEMLNRVVIKASTQPKINQPLLGLMGFSTVTGLSRCGRNGDFLSSGLASRFIFWIITKHHDTPMPLVGKTMDFESLMTELRRIFNTGRINQFGTIADAQATIASLQEVLTSKKPRLAEHVPVMDPNRQIDATDDARSAIRDIESAMKKEVQSLSATDDDETISLLKRKPLTIIKLACLRAMSDSRETVLQSDVAWAETIATFASKGVGDFFALTAGVTNKDEETLQKAARVLKYLSRVNEPMSKAFIMNRLKLTDRSCDEVLLHLLAGNRLTCLDGYGNVVYPMKIVSKNRFVVKN